MEPTPNEIAKKMEMPMGEEDDSHLGDFIEDKYVINPSSAIVSLNLIEQTRRVLATLTPREDRRFESFSPYHFLSGL